MVLCPTRLAGLATGLKKTGGGFSYATYSGRIFLYMALKAIHRAINAGADIAGHPLPATKMRDDVAGVMMVRHAGPALGTVLATSDPVAAAIRPHLSGGDEISVMAPLTQLKYIRSLRDGGPWMDFFEDYLIPQVELRLLIAGVGTTVVHSCDSASWRFRRFMTEEGDEF
jgi:hypothetical protein